LEVLVGDTLAVHSQREVRIVAAGASQDMLLGQFFQTDGISGLCVTGGQIIVRVTSVRSAGILRALRFDGRETLQFGDAFQHPDEAVREYMSNGLVACAADGGSVVASMLDGPMIYGYKTDGQPAWTIRIEDFRPRTIRLVENPNGPALSRYDGSASDQILVMTPLVADIVLVQVAKMSASESSAGVPRRRIQTLDSYLIAASTGDRLYAGDELPRVLHATDRRLFAVATDAMSAQLQLHVYGW
jgi:hypothetical protein